MSELIGIYLHEFTNNEREISIPHEAYPSVVLKISSSLLVNERRRVTLTLDRAAPSLSPGRASVANVLVPRAFPHSGQLEQKINEAGDGGSLSRLTTPYFVDFLLSFQFTRGQNEGRTLATQASPGRDHCVVMFGKGNSLSQCPSSPSSTSINGYR